MTELLYLARNAEEFTRIRIDLSALPMLTMTPTAEASIVNIMAMLAERGQHRTSIPDIMLAGIAHAHSAVILHYDSDYERIAEAAGISHEWIIKRGTGHDKT